MSKLSSIELLWYNGNPFLDLTRDVPVVTTKSAVISANETDSGARQKSDEEIEAERKAYEETVQPGF